MEIARTILKVLMTGYVPGGDLSPLAGLTKLEELHLQALDKITDITPLKGLTSLKVLELGWSLSEEYREQAVAELQAALPNCSIEVG